MLKQKIPGRDHACDIAFCSNPFEQCASRIRKQFFGAAVISDRNVAALYGGQLADRLTAKGVPNFIETFPPGDRSKSRETKRKIEDTMISRGVGRDWAVVALGGGVTGDLAGFVAATYMRGIAWLNVPASLLAMVDASIGGKTSVNTMAGKNLVGAFHQPEAVYFSIDLLKTLPGPGWLDGSAEIIKHAVITDRSYFELLEKNMPVTAGSGGRTLTRIIRRSVEIKSDIVERDEKENNLRSILNFGHTIGHAVEAAAGYRLPHGTCVALGMVMEAQISNRLGLLAPGRCERIEALLLKAGFRLPRKKIQASSILKAMQVDKKKKEGGVRMVLLRDIGEIATRGGQFSRRVPAETIKDVVGAWLKQ
ncbi:MAG: 3-dehydroquinate synthase [Pseudomonadota bacterium]